MDFLNSCRQKSRGLDHKQTKCLLFFVTKAENWFSLHQVRPFCLRFSPGRDSAHAPGTYSFKLAVGRTPHDHRFLLIVVSLQSGRVALDNNTQHTHQCQEICFVGDCASFRRSSTQTKPLCQKDQLPDISACVISFNALTLTVTIFCTHKKVILSELYVRMLSLTLTRLDYSVSCAVETKLRVLMYTNFYV